MACFCLETDYSCSSSFHRCGITSFPGVAHTGPFNQHFIRDIGLIQMFLGAAFGIGMIRPASRLELWAAAPSWLIAHAVLHLWEVAIGICSPSVIARDFPAVTLPALIALRLRRGPDAVARRKYVTPNKALQQATGYD